MTISRVSASRPEPAPSTTSKRLPARLSWLPAGNTATLVERSADGVEWGERDTEVLDRSSSANMARNTRLKLARCEAHRRRWSNTLRHLEEADPTRQDIEELAQQDEAIRRALEQDRVRKWFEGLPKSR